MSRSVFLIITVIVFFCSCGPAKKTQAKVIIKDTVAVAVDTLIADHGEDSVAFIKETYKQVLQNHIDFTTFSAKVDVDYKDSDGKDVNATAHVRMYKDSIIWLSVTGPLGIEGLRVYLTTDSLKYLDKQDKVYVSRSLSYLQEVIGLPLTLGALQDLLIGNPVFLDSSIISYSRSANTISLLSQDDFFKNLLTVNETDKRVQNSKIDDLDTLQNRSCFLTYAGYENDEGIYFSTKRTITISELKKLDFKLDFRQYEFNKTLSFPFAVPKNYKPN